MYQNYKNLVDESKQASGRHALLAISFAWISNPFQYPRSYYFWCRYVDCQDLSRPDHVLLFLCGGFAGKYETSVVHFTLFRLSGQAGL